MKTNELENLDETFVPQERVGRFVRNSRGGKSVVVLKRIHWLYLDWLESKGGNIEKYIIACDRKCKECDLSHALEWWVYWLFQDRKAEGLPLPRWLTEDGCYKADN